jgi:hypothetical protein
MESEELFYLPVVPGKLLCYYIPTLGLVFARDVVVVREAKSASLSWHLIGLS